MNRLPPKEVDYDCAFTRWAEERQQDCGVVTEDARRGWYAAASFILDKLEEQIEVAFEFDNDTDAELLREQIEFIQNEL